MAEKSHLAEKTHSTGAQPWFLLPRDFSPVLFKAWKQPNIKQQLPTWLTIEKPVNPKQPMCVAYTTRVQQFLLHASRLMAVLLLWEMWTYGINVSL